MPKHRTLQTTSAPPPSAARIRPRIAAGILLAAFLTGTAAGTEGAGDAAAQAKNRLANMTALCFRNYYIGRITDTDADGNQFWLRTTSPIESMCSSALRGPRPAFRAAFPWFGLQARRGCREVLAAHPRPGDSRRTARGSPIQRWYSGD